MEGLAILWEKISATWYMSMFLGIYVIIFLLKKIIVDCCMRVICGTDSEKYVADRIEEAKKKDESE